MVAPAFRLSCGDAFRADLNDILARSPFDAATGRFTRTLGPAELTASVEATIAAERAHIASAHQRGAALADALCGAR